MVFFGHKTYIYSLAVERSEVLKNTMALLLVLAMLVCGVSFVLLVRVGVDGWRYAETYQAPQQNEVLVSIVRAPLAPVVTDSVALIANTPVPGTCQGMVIEPSLVYANRSDVATSQLTLRDRVMVLAYSKDERWVKTDLGWIEARNLAVGELCSYTLPVLDH